MVRSYTAKYTRISSGYIRPLVEWVCSTTVIDLAKTLGADQVIDYTKKTLRKTVRPMTLFSILRLNTRFRTAKVHCSGLYFLKTFKLANSQIAS